MNVLRLLIVLAFFTLWALILMAVSALANDQLILQNKHILNINRPWSVLVTEDFTPAIRQGATDESGLCTERSVACTINAYGKGRAITFIKPTPEGFSHMYHEGQHVSGVHHTKDGD